MCLWACGGLSALAVLMLILTFTVFIPATVQSVVDDSVRTTAHHVAVVQPASL